MCVTLPGFAWLLRAGALFLFGIPPPLSVKAYTGQPKMGPIQVICSICQCVTVPMCYHGTAFSVLKNPNNCRWPVSRRALRWLLAWSDTSPAPGQQGVQSVHSNRVSKWEQSWLCIKSQPVLSRHRRALLTHLRDFNFHQAPQCCLWSALLLKGPGAVGS